ncbi:hypothetical protein MTP99_016616 [Tenebrio molitor]|nr:hypothetical protein MTP99_016616 [Tenebrio molitor]
MIKQSKDGVGAVLTKPSARQLPRQWLKVSRAIVEEIQPRGNPYNSEGKTGTKHLIVPIPVEVLKINYSYERQPLLNQDCTRNLPLKKAVF